MLVILEMASTAIEFPRESELVLWGLYCIRDTGIIIV